MKVRDVMTPAPACCTRDATLREVAALMIEHDCGAIPVVDSTGDCRPIGMVTDRDLVVRAIAQGAAADAPVRDYISAPCIQVHPEDPLAQCCAVMEEQQIRRVLVVEDERVCGIVSLADVARHAGRVRTGDVVKEVSEPT